METGHGQQYLSKAVSLNTVVPLLRDHFQMDLSIVKLSQKGWSFLSVRFTVVGMFGLKYGILECKKIQMIGLTFGYPENEGCFLTRVVS